MVTPTVMTDVLRNALQNLASIAIPQWDQKQLALLFAEMVSLQALKRVMTLIQIQMMAASIAMLHLAGFAAPPMFLRCVFRLRQLLYYNI